MEQLLSSRRVSEKEQEKEMIALYRQLSAREKRAALRYFAALQKQNASKETNETVSL
jgi:hypothetical protein